jgi:gamma-glutamyltranspeptidase/glutathione hydrolase
MLRPFVAMLTGVLYRKEGTTMLEYRFALWLAVAGALMGQTTRSRQTMRPVVRGTRHAVASMKPEATQAAERILRAGGNAFDAVVAGQAVLGLVDAALNGVGGDAVLLIYDARAKKVFSLNAEGTAPRLATIDWYQRNAAGKLPVNDTLLAGTVPGVVDAWYILLERWGTMSFAQVLAPAIEMAENGFPLSERLANTIAMSKKLRKYPSSVRLYYPGGNTPRAGEVFRNPDLARTLRRLVEAERENAPRGRREALRAARDRFYKGDIAREMARFAEANGGLFRYEDFASYTAKVEEPVWIDYRGYRVYKNASATQGPAELFLLNILETYDLKALGHNSAEYVHASVEAAKLAFADRDKYLGDMDFIRIPFEGLLSKEYAGERRKLIDPAKASLEFRPGVAEKFMTGFAPVERPADYTLAGGAEHDGDTSYIAVVDQDGNMISFTPSLHSAFGTGVVIGELGFIFNCRGDYYSLVAGHANALEPGKRPRSTLQSTLVMKDGLPAMVMGSPGGDDQCLRTLQTFLNMVEFGMNVQQAIEAPRWTTRSFPASPWPHTMYPGDLGLEERFSEEVRKALGERGHKVLVYGPWSLGANAAIVVDAKAGVLSAGADPRVDAYALAW